jgi:hypothetical protein
VDSDGLVPKLEEDFVEVLRSLDCLGENDRLVEVEFLEETVQRLDLVVLGDFAVELVQSMKRELFLVVDQDFLRLLIVNCLLFA